MKHSNKELNRREFIKYASAGIGAVAGLPAGLLGAEKKGQRPNVLFIFSDQQHWQAIGFKDGFFDTPNLDQLAESSVVFDSAFCTTPQCSPSRSSMMMGLYPSKTGVMGNIGAAGGEDLKTKTIGARLQTAGYHTGYIGKWHLGDNAVGTAGWDEDLGVISRGGRKDPDKTKAAVEFLSRVKDTEKPFALFVSYINPHDIYHFREHDFDAPAQEIELPNSWYKETFEGKPSIQKEFMLRNQGTAIWGKEKHQWQRYRDCYRAKTKLYDENVGAVLRELKKQGLLDETIIIVTSDHGDMDTHHKLIFKGPFMYEQMVRVPLIIRVPRRFGGIKPCRVSDLDVVNVDFVPTLLDFCGLEPIECDGFSLKPVLTGVRGQKKRDFVIGQYYSKQQWVNPIRMLRTAEFKYNRYIDQVEELYDLSNDPEELVNLASVPKYAKIKKELASRLDKWMKDNGDPFYSLSPTKLEKKNKG